MALACSAADSAPAERGVPSWEQLSPGARAYLLDIHALDATVWQEPPDGEDPRPLLVDEAKARATERRREVRGLLASVEKAPDEERFREALEALKFAQVTDRSLQAWGLANDLTLEERLDAAHKKAGGARGAEAFGRQIEKAGEKVGGLTVRYAAGGAERAAADLDSARLHVPDPALDLSEPKDGPLVEVDPAKQREEIFRRANEPPDAELEYLGPGAKKAGTLDQLWGGVKSLVSLHRHKTTPEEQAKLDQYVARLKGTKSGQKLLESLGGEETLRKEVHLTFAGTPSKGTYAYARPMTPWEQGRYGKKYVVVIGEHLKDQPEEVVVPVVGHELRHIKDFREGNGSHGLHIPSEWGAHGWQIYISDDLWAQASPQRREELKKNPAYQNQRFIEALWKDRILEKYPTEEAFMKEFEGRDFPYRAQAAYRDLANKKVAPGSAQLRYHISDLYNTLTDERDIADLIKDSTDPAMLEKLKKRNAMVGAQAEDDKAIRRQKGYELTVGGR